MVVPPPLSDPRSVDPEEAFVAALASCPLLWFLSRAAKASFVVDDDADRAGGVLGKDAAGRTALTVVTLRPAVRLFAGAAPSEEDFRDLHRRAHEACFLASSVRTGVRCEPLRVEAA
jgi:organic hydroperoxide reductase OsmC/OhrA